jgi:thiosulfate dehydrogenase [quinone] large subunit
MSLLGVIHSDVSSSLLIAGRWLAVLRIGLGLWWLESFRHKNKRAWLKEGSGISWGRSVAEKHPWGFVKTGFEKVVAPRPRLMAYVIVFGELALGLGLVLGFLTPVAAAFSILLNLIYFVLMIKDWAEQGQNLMMILAAVVVLGAHGWQCLSLDHALKLFPH